ncbi:MAG: hypothetical protein K9L02_07795 [Acholeplasmataceae bacterium]|nr:hypothetical protein [Acholeplasmataceae bacterium]
MPFTYVSVEKELIEKAKIEAEKRMQFGFRGPVRDLNYKHTMILISCIGELVFQRYLDSNSIKYTFIDPSFSGKEIKINDKIVEIRTSGYDNDFSRLNFIYAVDQYDQSVNKGIDYVLQIFIKGYKQQSHIFDESECETAVLAGYIEFDAIQKFPIEQNRYRPNYKIDLDYLYDVSDLI